MSEGAAATTATEAITTTATTTAGTSELPYYCSSCGRRFSSWGQLRAHCASTKHPFPEEFKKKREEVAEKGPPSLRGLTHTKGAEGGPQVPDALSLLEQFLRIFGLSERDAKAVVKYMESFDVNDLVTLNRALSDIGLPVNRRRMLIEAWANARGLAIPFGLKRELGLATPQLATAAPPIAHYDPRAEEMIVELQQRGYQVLPPLATSLSSHPTGTGRELVELVKVVLEKLAPSQLSQSNPNGEVVKALLEENERLQKEVEELKQRHELESLINPLKEELSAIKAEMGKLRQTTDVQTEFVRGVFDVVKDGLGIYKSVVERVMRISPEPPPRRVLEGSTSIVDKIREAGGLVDLGGEEG